MAKKEAAKELQEPRKMILSELKIGDQVQYLWTGAWETFEVRKIESIQKLGVIHDLGGRLFDNNKVIQTSYTIELWSPTMRRSAWGINQSSVDRGQLRWPMTEDEKKATALAELSLLREELTQLRGALAAVEKRFVTVKATLS